MSGHSKWATIKHKKANTDAKRAKVFAKLIRQVEVAAREGGGDLDANPTLRTFYQKARDNSIPLDTIERAIKRATGDLDGVVYEQVTYEGYGPNGVAVLMEVLTDNRNRAAADVRSALTKNGGSPAEPGAVSWQFDRKGVIIVPKSVSEDELMETALEAGAEDITDEGEVWQVLTAASDLPDVRDALDAAEIAVENSEVTMLPQNTVPITESDKAKSILRIIEALEDLDDVQNVYANFDMSAELYESSAG
ncbi:YebC/PmpR family DNA-binding transcriptional regulator [Actinospongicola halichondriae]|uniref:YebC/PmpR family DNA-binding transcriptional regulator n=1 Tax=Actinospongicola halichondriae TaxID=3236844 RepID=UPI003D43AE80